MSESEYAICISSMHYELYKLCYDGYCSVNSNYCGPMTVS